MGDLAALVTDYRIKLRKDYYHQLLRQEFSSGGIINHSLWLI